MAGGRSLRVRLLLVVGGLILAVATRYKKDLGIGTMVATMLPYTIFFIIGWTLLFYLWVFALGLPVGPGSPTLYPAG